MTKHKKTVRSHNNITTIFGYSLFALTVLSFLVSTVIPFSFSFQYEGARHFNIAIMVITFAVAVILPALASYLIGDRATHAKNKSLHHYNGVLFGVTAYWTAQLFSWIGFSSILGVSQAEYPIPMFVSNGIPVIITIVLMAIIAGAYAKRTNNKTSVLQYRPFQIVLIASVVGTFLYPYISGEFDIDFTAMTIGLFAVPAVLVAIAYKVLAKYQTTRLSRLSDAVVAMSIGWVATLLAGSFIALLEQPYQLYEIESIVAYTVGLAIFATYLRLRTRQWPTALQK
jgi:membrane protein YqaA with SNARE-associated domain